MEHVGHSIRITNGMCVQISMAMLEKRLTKFLR